VRPPPAAKQVVENNIDVYRKYSRVQFCPMNCITT
jgi:hypothetical protein